MLENIFVFHASVFAAQASVDSDCSIPRRYAVAGHVGFRVYGPCVVARQGASESDSCISKRYVSSMPNDIEVC